MCLGAVVDLLQGLSPDAGSSRNLETRMVVFFYFKTMAGLMSNILISKMITLSRQQFN